ncbi:MAG: hypothetical protein ABJH73_12775, partial [Nonlabens ulvanivorans]
EFLQESDDGELVVEPVKVTMPVYEKVYLDLQNDEIEFSNSIFKTLYPKIVDLLLMQGKVDLNQVMSTLNEHEARLVADLVMQEDKYQLHKWDGKMIFVKSKDETVSTYTMDAILNFRRLMIEEKIKALFETISKDPAVDNTDVLSTVRDYNKLSRYLGRRLNRVV